MREHEAWSSERTASADYVYGTVAGCPPGYSRDIACPSCAGVTRECLTGTTCCRCVGTCQDASAPPPDGSTPPEGTAPAADPWARLADVIGSIGGGGMIIAAPPEAAVTYVPQEQRASPWLGLAILGGAGALGYWWYRNRRRGGD